MTRRANSRRLRCTTHAERKAAQQGSTAGASMDLDWRVLDCEEDEWQQAIGAGGVPSQIAAAPDLTGPADTEKTPHLAQAGELRLRTRPCGQAIALAALLLAAVALVGLRVWQDAERGLALIKQDIATAVTLETVKENAIESDTDEQSQVRSIKFQGNQAMVQVVVTRTALCGTVTAQRQTRFYAHSGHGWQRTYQAPALWGGTLTLDTPHLHFIYRELDRTAVTAIAPGAEALEALLVRLFASSAITASRPLTIEVVPRLVLPVSGQAASYLEISSPLFLYSAADQTDADVLAWQLRYRLANRAIESALQRQPVGEQWDPVTEGMRSWLLFSELLPLSQKDRWIPFRPTGGVTYALAPLHFPPWCGECDSAGGTKYAQQKLIDYRAAQGQLLIEYIARTYGTEKLAALYAGLGRFDSWEALTPAVFGIRPQELEADWLAWMDSADQ